MTGQPRRARMEPLWDRVDRNRVTLGVAVLGFALLSGLSMSLLVGAFIAAFVLLAAFGDAWNASHYFGIIPSVLFYVGVLGTLLGALWSGFTLLRSEKWLLKRFGATLVPKGELLPTKYALKDMAIAAGFQVAPALHVIETRNVNAFLVAASRRRAVVGITRGFAERLDSDEQRAAFSNLIARLRSGDVIVDTGLTALMWPLHVWRESRLAAEDDDFADALAGRQRQPSGQGDGGIVLFFLFGVAFTILAEVIAYGHRRSQLRRAEKADAEGMLLLKDPLSMLSALEKCIRYDNVVTSAGEAFGQLFYCWPGDSSNDEEDPEWERVSRLREVLGVEGMSADVALGRLPEGLLPPVAPRVEHGG